MYKVCFDMFNLKIKQKNKQKSKIIFNLLLQYLITTIFIFRYYFT